MWTKKEEMTKCFYTIAVQKLVKRYVVINVYDSRKKRAAGFQMIRSSSIRRSDTS